MEESSGRIDTLQAIELAEGVEVRLRIAGPFLRGMALLIDLALLVLVLVIAGIILTLAGVALDMNLAEGAGDLVWFFLWWWFPVFFEASPWGATPGKRAMGLRVVQTSGAPITFAQALLRCFLRAADGMPFLG